MSPLLYLLAFLCPLIYVLRAIISRLIDDRKLPPGPPCLPIIGNLHLLGSLPHRALHQLAKKHGHIMSLRLGYVPTIVVSSPQAAELFLKTHDAVFASRPKSQASLYMSYGAKGIAFTEYGPYWRNVKKLCISHVLSSSKIEYFEPLRREEVGLFIDSIKKAAAAHEAVDISKMAGNVIQRMACRMLFGENKDDEIDMKSLVKEAVLLAGAFNIADYVPFRGAFDLQGLTKRMKAFSKSMDKILEKIIDEHEQDVPRQNNQPNDFVDVLLSLLNDRNKSLDEKTSVIDRTNIKAIIIDMIVGTVDTSSTTVEWTLSELLRHPHIMKRVQKELDGAVGMHRMVDEKDLSSLTYLDMVIKESYRLHPIAPLLVPHESMEDITIDGHYIPKKSRVIINTWAIGRDPNAWSDSVELFIPERFKDANIDIQGHDFQLIPFGSGRRRCPGIQLGLTIVKLILAQLLHCFDWKLPNGMLPSELDMSEIFGLAIQRVSPLIVVPTYRLQC